MKNLKNLSFFVRTAAAVLILFFIYAAPSYAVVVDKVVIDGNKRVPEARVEPYLVKPGKDFTLRELDGTVKNLYDTGLFLNITTDLYVDGPDFVLKYRLREMPLVGSVIFQGNKEIKTKDLRDKITLKNGKVLNFGTVESSLEAVRAAYENENRYGTEVTFRIEPRTVNSVDVYFDIKESPKSKIYNIKIYGNENIPSKEIKNAIPTKERTFWSPVSGSGKISKDSLAIDREVVRMLYLERGYAQVAVGEPDVRFDPENPIKADMIIRIKEGKKFYVRSVDITGYENIPLEKLEPYIGLKPGGIFNVRRYQADIANLTEVYTSSGYAYANVEPVITLDQETDEVDVVYKIEENILVHVGRITIKGNKTSHDNVIRRQIDQMEGALYDSSLIREAKANTMATGFYENVQITEKPAGEGVVDLDVDVTEQSTGSFTVGAAYSTLDGIMGMVQLSRNNFMGWGHSVSLKAEVSQKRMDFSLSYTDPWFMDWPISVGFDIFNLEREWYEYKRNSLGGSIRIGHALIKRRLFMNYRLSIYTVDIYDIDDAASKYIKEQKGKTTTHSISPSIVWNSLNNAVDPSAGNKSQIYLDFAGSILGGDANFLKIGGETSQFFPLVGDDLVLMLHGETGYITSTKAGTKIPVDERFRLGGINSIRGFDYGEISPLDEDGYEYGGDKYYQINVELTFPLKKDIKLKGLLFYDMGQVYGEDQSFLKFDPRKTVGAGLRWLTPMGTFRVEWGYKLDRRSGESPSKLEFSVGGMF